MKARAAAAYGLALKEGVRGVALNAALTDLVRLLDIGTPVPSSMER
jgi:replication-associated recombination protein RarA